MVHEAERMKEADDAKKEVVTKRNEIESFCYNAKASLEQEELAAKMSEEDKRQVAGACDEAERWLAEEAGDATADELGERMKLLEQLVHPIMKRVYDQQEEAPPAEEEQAEQGSGYG